MTEPRTEADCGRTDPHPAHTDAGAAGRLDALRALADFDVYLSQARHGEHTTVDVMAYWWEHARPIIEPQIDREAAAMTPKVSSGETSGAPEAGALRDVLRARRAGKRHLTFDNGRGEDYEAVEVWHESSGAMWDRILVARDDGTLAQRIVDTLNGAEAIEAMPRWWTGDDEWLRASRVFAALRGEYERDAAKGDGDD